VTPPRSRSRSGTGLLRELAKARLSELENASPEEWAKAVEEALKQGYELLRFPGAVVKIRLDI
jgi:hypothetical protein